MRRNSYLQLIISISALCFTQGCIAPRANLQSGRVTPKGDFSVGYDMTFNASLNTLDLAADQAVKEVKYASDGAEREVERDLIYDYSRIAMAYALDPVGSSNQLYVRYGLIDDLDLGVAYGSAGFIFDGAYQVLSHHKGPLDASIGLQYSAQEFELPSIAGDAQKLLGFDFKRDDFLLRATLSYPFGPDEEYGAFGFGAALNYTRLQYGFTAANVKYVDGAEVALLAAVPTDAESFLAYGGFMNLKLGYKYIYLVSSLSLYYQDYGTYNLPDDKSTAMSGLTIVPSLGLMGTF